MSLHISQRYQKNGTQVSVNLHSLMSVKSGRGSYGNAWVEFRDDAGSEIALHVDEKLADMLQEAFDEYHDWLSSQEGPSFDDAMAAKHDRIARENEARALK